MEELVRLVREELFDKAYRVDPESTDELVVTSAEIINGYRKRKFDIETECLIADAKREDRTLSQ
jgi:hypothetical protein